jgi:hypothetical protein
MLVVVLVTAGDTDKMFNVVLSAVVIVSTDVRDSHEEASMYVVAEVAAAACLVDLRL